MKITKHLFAILILLILSSSSSKAYNSKDFLELHQQLYHPSLNLNKTYNVSSDTIFHHDFALAMNSGRLAFFEPIVINDDSVVYGGYFEGNGSLLFRPSVQMERDQLNRFYHKDSLDEKVKAAIFFFAPTIYDSLQKILTLSDKSFDNGNAKKMQKLHSEIKQESDFLFSFELMRNLTSPFGRPYFLACMEPKSDYKVIYQFNPYEREEIKFWKQYWEPGSAFSELVNSYSQYNIDESYININGRNKAQLDVLHYDISTQINYKGVIVSEANVKAEVLSGPMQLVQFQILPSLVIDSIVDSQGRNVNYYRGKLDVTFKDWETRQTALFLNEEYLYGDTLSLTFYYHGEIAKYEFGELYLFAGSDWYPKYGWRDRATYDLKFKTDRRYTFTSCGSLQSESNQGDTLFTEWTVSQAAANISFNYGYMKKYKFEEDDIVPVEVYYSKELHADIANYLSQDLMLGIGKDMEKQVAEDVQNSLRVFKHYFGPYSLPSLSVSEILASHGESFPGFVHLGFNTWVNTDAWGNDRLFRAHEVAHQWWGVGVGYETYHDKWLSEGFAEYSALLYFQVITDNKKFLKKLKESRNNIFSVRKYIFSSGEESGPIAMGHRTSSTKTRGDYGLIIYEKSAFVLHMLRNLMIDLKTMNEDKFLKMMREFYGTYRGKDASTQDFKRIAEKYVGIELDWFFDQWVYNNYLPEYKFTYDIVHNDSTNLLDVKCRITTKGVPDDFKMYLPLEIQFGKESKAYIRILVDSKDYSFEIPGLSSRPRKIILNPFESVLAKVKQ